jgi:LemA protein
MKIIRRVIAVIIVAAVLVGWWFVATRNSIIESRNTVESSYDQVQNVLQRRADLIPPMINTVKAAMTHEEDVLTALTDARSSYEDASKYEKIDSTDALTTASKNFVDTVNEKYPELKSVKVVKNFMIDVQGSENRITVEKRQYASDVEAYDNKVETFPSSIVARAIGYEPIGQ